MALSVIDEAVLQLSITHCPLSITHCGTPEMMEQLPNNPEQIEQAWLDAFGCTPRSSGLLRRVVLLKQTGVSRTKQGQRKLRLFACGCCREFWESLGEPSRRAVLIAERYADGQARRQDLVLARRATVRVDMRVVRLSALDAGVPNAEHVAGYVSDLNAHYAAWLVAQIGHYVITRCSSSTEEADRALDRLTTILLDIFANPFRPAIANPAWLKWHDGTIPKLAAAIYDERAYQRLPLLADALEEAGCDDAAILEHCRGPNGHVRGCWVVDLLLGKG
jgi:hypothetical protein